MDAAGILVSGGWAAGTAPSSIGDFVFFKLIYDYLNRDISEAGLGLLSRMTAWVTSMALVTVTMWVFMTGYRIVTGQMRESLMQVVTHMVKISLIVTTASTMSLLGTDLQNFLAKDLGREINYLVTGKQDQSPVDMIDRNLAYTQAALVAIDAVQIVQGDDAQREAKAKAMSEARFGTAGPAMTAGAMLLLFEYAMMLFIGFGPLFILCLIFEQTKDMFRRWLLYGISTMFAMALLNFVIISTLGLSLRVAGAMWGAKFINAAIPGNSPEGLTSLAMQQGGIGLLLTVLIVTVPPLAGVFFGITVGNFMTYSAFGAGGAGQSGAQGQTTGTSTSSYAGQPRTGNQASTEGFNTTHAGTRISGSSNPQQADVIKKLDT